MAHASQLSSTRVCLGTKSHRSQHTVKAFSATNKPKKPYVCPGKNRASLNPSGSRSNGQRLPQRTLTHAAFANSLKAPGVELEEAQDGIPLVFHEIRRLLKPSKSSELAYDQEKIAGLLSGFAIKGNESTFTHAIIPELLPTIRQILDGDQRLRRQDDVVFDGFWQHQPPLDPFVTPPLSLPKTDLLHGFRGNTFDQYPLARKELGFHMRPVGLRSGLSFPYFSLEAKSCHGPPDVAVMQNAHATALMLRNLWLLTTKTHQGKEDPPIMRQAERLVVLSSVLTPVYCALDFHWLVPSEQLKFSRRRVRTWTFPDQFEDASKGLINAVDWAQQNLEQTLHRHLGRLEREMSQDLVSGSSAADYGTYDEP